MEEEVCFLETQVPKLRKMLETQLGVDFLEIKELKIKLVVETPEVVYSHRTQVARIRVLELVVDYSQIAVIKDNPVVYLEVQTMLLLEADSLGTQIIKLAKTIPQDLTKTSITNLFSLVTDYSSRTQLAQAQQVVCLARTTISIRNSSLQILQGSDTEEIFRDMDKALCTTEIS